MSETTSISLLERLRLEPDASSWERLVDIYTPLIRGWLGRQLRPCVDSDDLVQDVLAVVVRRLPEFQREPRTGAFRRWLRTITVNCLRDFWRAQRIRPAATGDSNLLQMLDQLEDPNSGPSRQWDLEHDRHVTQRLFELIKPQFETKTWQAFQRVALDGASPDVVAAELGISVNAVFIAKSRVLARLRQEGAGLID
jgi:RNA polymerase sigma-70 factor (ECF subfamily)